jgi:hypothetical protein
MAEWRRNVHGQNNYLLILAIGELTICHLDGQGKATKALQDILSMADQAGMTSYIEPVQMTIDVGIDARATQRLGTSDREFEGNPN